MAKDWDIIITNKSNLFSIDLGEVWRYRDLLTMYVKRDIVPPLCLCLFSVA